MANLPQLLCALVLVGLTAPQGRAQDDARVGDPATRLIGQLRAEQTRRAACIGLMKLGEKAVPGLVALSADPDRTVACIAADLLSRMGGAATKAVPALARLRDSDEPWRAHAARFAMRRILLQRRVIAVDKSANEVLVLGPDGELLKTFKTGQRLYDVDYLAGDRLLVCEIAAGRVLELDRDGKVVWEFKGNANPLDADRLVDGNTLIAGGKTKTVLEVDPKGEVVWSWKGTNWPNDADRLPWGNVLVSDSPAGQIYEVDRKGQVVRSYGRPKPIDCQLLPDGSIMYVTSNGHVGHVLDEAGKELRKITSDLKIQALTQSFDGTLVLGTKSGVELRDPGGKVLWRALDKRDIKAVLYH